MFLEIDGDGGDVSRWTIIYHLGWPYPIAVDKHLSLSLIEATQRVKNLKAVYKYIYFELRRVV
jgi:hypothetical protein